jgi:hypothetical protein
MLTIDGKKVDLTKPETLNKISIKPGGYVEQRKNGVTTRVKNKPKHQED